MLSSGPAGDILGARHPKESFAIAKRKPPSQRPESKIDDTAAAIARLRESAKTEKSAKGDRLDAAGRLAQADRAGTGAGHRKAAQVAPPPTTKRQKSG